MTVMLSNNSCNFFSKTFSSYLLVNKQIKNLLLFLHMDKSLKLLDIILKPYENLSLNGGNYLERKNTTKQMEKKPVQSIHRAGFISL